MSNDKARMYGGRWRVVREIGRGGQGIVYEVEDTSGLETEDGLLASFKTALRKGMDAVHHQNHNSDLLELVQQIKRVSATTTPPRAALKELLPPFGRAGTEPQPGAG